MTFFMYGWDRRWRDYEAQGMAGQPMVHAASNNFDRMGAEVGDVVYAVGNRDGRMILIGRLTIDHVVSREEAEFRLGQELIDKRAHVLTDAPETIVRFDREVPEDVARELRAVTGAGVKFVNDTDYRLSTQALMPMLRLTPESAQALDALLEAMPGGRAGAGSPDGHAPVTSAAINRAVERRAVEVTTEHLESQGWSVQDVGLVESYDLDCARSQESLHVEVKGTSGLGAAVSLTVNEVEHARDGFPDVALAIVSSIRVEINADAEPVAMSGDLQFWQSVGDRRWQSRDHRLPLLATLSGGRHEVVLFRTKLPNTLAPLAADRSRRLRITRYGRPPTQLRTRTSTRRRSRPMARSVRQVARGRRWAFARSPSPHTRHASQPVPDTRHDCRLKADQARRPTLRIANAPLNGGFEVRERACPGTRSST